MKRYPGYYHLRCELVDEYFGTVCWPESVRLPGFPPAVAIQASVAEAIQRHYGVV